MGRVSNLSPKPYFLPPSFFSLSFFSGLSTLTLQGEKKNSHSAFVGITAASLPTLRPIFKLMSGEKFSQLFSQLLQSKSRSGPSKPGSKSLSNNEGKKSFKRPNDGNAVKMNNSTEKSQQAVVVTLSNQQPDTSQLSLLPQNSVLVTTSFSHSIGSTRQDLESGSLDNEIYGKR